MASFRVRAFQAEALSLNELGMVMNGKRVNTEESGKKRG